MKKSGVLLINLGTPDAPTSSAIRRYLAQFLNDRRVVDLPRLLWWPILYGPILTFRPRRIKEAYASIWTEKGSPLRTDTLALAELLEQQLGGSVPVECGMCYGSPSIESALVALKKKGVKRVIALPLYPQYSATTTAAAFDEIARVFRQWEDFPGLSFIRDYYQVPGYVKALVQSVRDYWAEHGEADRLLMSFHGIPQRYFRRGDPYPDACFETAELLAEELELTGDVWGVGFQSRFGPEPWVQPYTEGVLKNWAEQGVKTVDVICPGFAVDCLETLDEIAVEYAQLFKDFGGQRLRYIPALNVNDLHIELLTSLVKNELTC